VLPVQDIERLLKNSSEWNRWRNSNNVSPDLCYAELRGESLNGLNLSKSNLMFANLRNASLVGANLDGANLDGAKLTGADLNVANLSGANLKAATVSGANLSGAGLNGANLRGARLTSTNLSGADLSSANLTDAMLANANLTGANLKVANLSGAHLDAAIMNRANLKGANLSRGHLNRADLSGADLTTAILTSATLIGAMLCEAKLSEADLSYANLVGANLNGANLSYANLNHANLKVANLTGVSLAETILSDVDFVDVIGLESCRHSGPSILDFRTLTKSWPLPLVFLRGVGLPDNLIEYLPSLLSQPIQYFSCFISYSSKDDAFARRIHADLQNNGVRCWFAPHDLPIGGKILDEIDAAIRLRDKVVLILSEHSIGSDWVEDEVKTAYEEERRRRQTVLFPLRLDDSVMDTEEAWAAKLRADRNIGDFRQWKDHDQYQECFGRALRDLTAPVGKSR
jgi:uncharacterized protein YjbI with pentapeptide repeats